MHKEERVKAKKAINHKTGLVETTALCPFCGKAIYLDLEKGCKAAKMEGGCFHISGYSMGGNGDDPMNTPLTFVYREETRNDGCIRQDDPTGSAGKRRD